MIEITLRVQYQGQTYTYENIQFVGDRLQSSSRISGGQVERSHIDLSLMGGAFLGEDLSIHIEDGYWRAELHLKDTSIDVEHTLQGAIAGTGVTCDDKLGNVRVWGARFEMNAAADLLERLEQQDIYGPDFVQAAHARGTFNFNRGLYWNVSTKVEFEAGFFEDTYRWYDLTQLWYLLLERTPQVDVAGHVQDQLFDLDIRWLDGQGNELTHSHLTSVCVMYPGEPFNVGLSYSDENHTIPRWNGRKLWEVLRQMTGFRLTPRYAEFPSNRIEFRWEPGRWELPPLFTSVDSDLTDSGYELRTDPPESPDFALAYENDLGILDTWPEPALYASQQQRIVDGRAANESVTNIELRLPEEIDDIEVQSFSAPSGYTEDQEIGTPGLRDRDAAYVCAIVSGKALQKRMPDQPAGSQVQSVGEHWAFNLYPNHVLEAAPLHVLEGDFDIHQERAVGWLYLDGTAYTQAEGYGWKVYQMEYDHDQALASIQLIMPSLSYDVEATLATVGEPTSLMAWAYTTEYRDEEGELMYADNEAWWEWEHPDAPADRPEHYEMELYDDEGELVNRWMLNGAYTSYEVYAYGGRDELESWDYVRVRSVYRIAGPSEWVQTEIPYPQVVQG